MNKEQILFIRIAKSNAKDYFYRLRKVYCKQRLLPKNMDVDEGIADALFELVYSLSPDDRKKDILFGVLTDLDPEKQFVRETATYYERLIFVLLLRLRYMSVEPLLKEGYKPRKKYGN